MKIKLTWNVSKRSPKAVSVSMSHYTFSTCKVKC